MPRSVGLLVASLAELFSKISGKEPGFTRFRVKFSCYHRYYDIRKAKELLGYKAEVSLSEGLKRTIAWFKETEAGEQALKTGMPKAEVLADK